MDSMTKKLKELDLYYYKNTKWKLNKQSLSFPFEKSERVRGGVSLVVVIVRV